MQPTWKCNGAVIVVQYVALYLQSIIYQCLRPSLLTAQFQKVCPANQNQSKCQLSNLILPTPNRQNKIINRLHVETHHARKWSLYHELDLRLIYNEDMKSN
jgi:hypothetical protein